MLPATNLAQGEDLVAMVSIPIPLLPAITSEADAAVATFERRGAVERKSVGLWRCFGVMEAIMMDFQVGRTAMRTMSMADMMHVSSNLLAE